MADDDTTRILKRRSFSNDETIVNSTEKQNIKSTYEDDESTKLFRPSNSNQSELSQNLFNSNDKLAIEPVAGWLVIIDGSGKGKSLTIGFGMNSIGRSSEDRIPLDFGDEEISRKSHALITYDPKGSKFYLNHGGGINLTYLGSEPVLSPLELKGREIISIGNTKLCFIPFCGPEFNW